MPLSKTQKLIATGCGSLVLAAFARGYFLLGVFVGFMFASAAAATLFVIIREFRVTQRFPLVRQSVAIVFGLAVFSLLAMPTWLNPDLRTFIEGHQSEQATRSQMRSVLLSDPRFSTLEFDCRFRKCIILNVRGSVKSEKDLLDLRDRIFEQCSDVSSRWLFWDVTCIDSGVTRSDCDLQIYGDEELKSKYR